MAERSFDCWIVLQADVNNSSSTCILNASRVLKTNVCIETRGENTEGAKLAVQPVGNIVLLIHRCIQLLFLKSKNKFC